MSKKKKISRKSFIKSFLYFLSIPFTTIWIKGINRNSILNSPKETILPIDFSEGINFRDNFIVVKNKNNLAVYSSQCTHLGCKIESEINGKLVCPCHGSEFNKDGFPVTGPASKPLKNAKYKFNTNHSSIIING